MRTFAHPFDYSRFKDAVIGYARYRNHAEQEEFIRTVEETGRKRMIPLDKGTELYRAQLGGTQRGFLVRFTHPFPPERMIPEPGSAKEGRVNPKGIPCLYLANNQKTAMAEVRPWIGAHVSIGHFRTVKDLVLMDCAASWTKELTTLNDVALKNDPSLTEEAIWGEISNAFSEPVNDSDMKADYAPTQVLAEVFKRMGCDGVKYKSVLGEGGHSYALFDLESATIFRCAICEIWNISHRFSGERRSYEVDSEGKQVPKLRRGS